jgi:predicted HAD superfamily Cof-like phosphohydrolase
LQSQVIEFHKLFGQAIEPVPTIPSRKVVALRVMLVIEEALEFLESCVGSVPEKLLIEEMVRNVLNVREPKVDLAGVADALGDLDYVVEGSRLAFGIDGESIADAIHASNIEKIGGKLRQDGKQGKPSNWTPPDIEGVLFKQNSGELPSVADRLEELEAKESSESARWGIWLTIEHWATVFGGHDWTGTREQTIERAGRWRSEAAPGVGQVVTYEVRPYTGTDPADAEELDLEERLEHERALAPKPERWGVWVSSDCDRDSDDGWISNGLRAVGSRKGPWLGTETEARAYAEELSKEPGRARFGHEARKFVTPDFNFPEPLEYEDDFTSGELQNLQRKDVPSREP